MMKKTFLPLFILSTLLTGIFLSCRKETSCEGGCADKNKPPIAFAGPDQVITLPTDSISLDGSASNDPDGMISLWLWKKISGPASYSPSRVTFWANNISFANKLIMTEAKVLKSNVSFIGIKI